VRVGYLAAAAITFLGAAALLPLAAAATPTIVGRGAVIPTPAPSPALPIVPAVASGYRAPLGYPSNAEIVGVSQHPFVAISLPDAIGTALLHNGRLAISSSSLRIAKYQVVEAKAPFDVQLRVEQASTFSVQQPLNALEGGPGSVTYVSNISGNVSPVYNPGNIIQHQSSFSYGLGGQTVNGLQYVAGIQQSRTFNNTWFDAYNPYYIASLGVSLTQPLLRDAGMNAAKERLKLSMVNADATGAEALVTASNTLAQVEGAYWDLVAAWRNVAIQEDALKAAVVQQQSNVRLAQRGAAAPIDAVESSTQVSEFQDNVFSAVQHVSELQNRLKDILVTSSRDPIWKANLVPSFAPSRLPDVPSLGSIVATALTHRPEVRQALDKQRAADIDVAFARNQALPRADVNVTYRSNGFAGLPAPESIPGSFVDSVCPVNSNLVHVCPVGPPQSRGTMAYAYHNLWAGTYPSFNVSLNVSFPLQNHAATGLKAQASQEETQARIAIQGVRERIEAEARNALQAYQSALARLYASRNARAAAEAVYASELRKFHNGASTTFLVLQREVQLAQARGQELQAQTDLNKSIVEIQRVEGTILSDNHVNVETLGSEALH
jgi:outer membrane protein TolC